MRYKNLKNIKIVIGNEALSGLQTVLLTNKTN